MDTDFTNILLVDRTAKSKFEIDELAQGFDFGGSAFRCPGKMLS
jgi:hypothetical protein